MALELVFVCSRTLGKLRSGPLGKLLDGYCDWLLGCGFSRSTIRKHLSNVSHLNGLMRKMWQAGRLCRLKMLMDSSRNIHYGFDPENHRITISVAADGR